VATDSDKDVISSLRHRVSELTTILATLQSHSPHHFTEACKAAGIVLQHSVESGSFARDIVGHEDDSDDEDSDDDDEEEDDNDDEEEEEEDHQQSSVSVHRVKGVDRVMDMTRLLKAARLLKRTSIKDIFSAPEAKAPWEKVSETNRKDEEGDGGIEGIEELSLFREWGWNGLLDMLPASEVENSSQSDSDSDSRSR
jgi:hypothetical protein